MPTHAFAASSLLILFTSSIIACVVIWRCRDRKLSSILGLFCLCAALWGLGSYKFSTTNVKEDALFWWRVGYIGPIFASSVYAHFVCSLLKLNRKRLLTAAYLFSCFFFLVDVISPRHFFGDLTFVFNQFYYIDWPKEKHVLYVLFYAFFYLFLLHYSFFLLVKHYRHSSGIFREQLKYFISGSVIGWWGAHGDFLPAFRIYAYPYTHVLIALYPILWAYAIMKYRLLDIRVAISRTGLFFLVYAVILGVPFYVGYRTRQWFVSTVLMLVLTVVGNLVYRKMRITIENFLLSQQRSYQKLLLQVAERMIREYRLERLLRWIVLVLKHAVGINYLAVFLNDKDKKAYNLREKRDNGEIPADLSFSYEHPFIGYLSGRHEPFFYDELPQAIRSSLNIPFVVNLVIPSFVENQALGFLLLGEKHNRSAYSQDDINVFKILSYQAGLAIENALLYNNLQKEALRLRDALQELNQTQNQLIQNEKMVAVGRLASGFAHEIRNPLGTIRQGVDYLKSSPAIDDQMTANIIGKMERSIVRANSIIEDLYRFSRAPDLHFKEVRLADLITDSLLLVEHKAAEAGVIIRTHFPASDHRLRIMADGTMLQQAFLNLYTNAIEATASGGNLSVDVRDAEDSVVIVVQDSGKGITADAINYIFEPFFTTKDSGHGMGLGLSIVRMIIERHKGAIRVESEVGVGTSFIIALPKQPVGASIGQ